MLIYDLDLPSLENYLKEWNEPAYRAKQIWLGLYQHLYSAPEQFSNLPASLRARLATKSTRGRCPADWRLTPVAAISTDS